MKAKQIIFFVVISAIYIACKHEIDKVILPDNSLVEIAQYMGQQNYMILIYVDSSECTPCSFRHLARWYSMKDKFEKNGIGILLIFRNSDERAVIRTLRSIGTFHFIFDKGGKFKANNNVFKYVKDNIFMIDKDRNVVMTESPVASKKSWTSFIKLITHYNVE